MTADRETPDRAPLRTRRLFGGEEALQADVRPTLLGVVTLMFLLLFFLLNTSSGARLAATSLRLEAPDALVPLPHTGLLKSVHVRVQRAQITVEFELQSTDIAASATATEQHRRAFPARDGAPDLAGLLDLLDGLHRRDPSQQRARLSPDDDVPVEALLQVMDAVRGPDDAPMFPKIILGGG